MAPVTNPGALVQASFAFPRDDSPPLSGRLTDYSSPGPWAWIRATEVLVEAKRKAGLLCVTELTTGSDADARREWVVGRVLERRRNGNDAALHNTCPAAEMTAMIGSPHRLFPKDWNLFHYLIAGDDISAGGAGPLPPLNLSSWFCVLPEAAKVDLRQRFETQIAWAGNRGIIDDVRTYLGALPDDGWIHDDEL